MYQRLAKLLRQSALYGIGSMSGKLLAILLLPLYTHYLLPAQYGAVETVLTIDLLLSAVVRLGLQNALMRFYYDGDNSAAHQERVTQTILIATFVLTTLGALLLCAFAGPFSEYFLGGADNRYLFYIGAFGVWSSALYQTVTATFRLEQRAATFLKVSLANVLLSAALTVTMVVGLEWGAGGLLAGSFVAQAAMVPVALAMQRRFLGLHFDGALLKEMLRFGLPTMPIGIANQGLRMVDRLILTRMAGLTAVGLYGVASRAAQVVMLVVIALQLSWQPFAYSIKDDDEARTTYAYVMSYFTAGIGWLVVAAALLADPVIRLVTADAYTGAARALPLLALAAGVYGMYFIAGIGASRVKQTQYHLFVALGALAVCIGANLLLVPHYGMMGSAIASVLANGALSLFMFLRSQHVFPVPYHWRRLATVGVVVGAALALTYTLPGGESWTLIPRMAGVLVYPLVLLGLGFFPARERRAIARRLGVRRRSKAVAQRLLDRWETSTSSGGKQQLPHAPIFIVGAPRSGSTLLYQLITDCYDVGYISNAHCRWHGAPSWVERRKRPLRDRDASDFSSDFGATARLSDPSECGAYWYRFFPRRPHYSAALPTRQRRRLRASMRALVKAFDRPVVIKNLYCTLRMAPLAAALPEAVYVHIRRDLVDNAHSLLQGRRKVTGDYANWWSAEPANIDELRALPVHEQVVEQVRSIDAQVEADRALVGADRVLEVGYEDLCADPAAALERIAGFLASHGIEVAERRAAPEPFERRTEVTIDPDLYEALRAYVAAESAVHA